MNTTQFSKLIHTSTMRSLLFFLLTLVTVLPAQAAIYTIEIDYWHPMLFFTDTKSGITITYLDKEGRELHHETAQGIFSLLPKNYIFTYKSDQAVKEISLEIAGNDAFFIDRIIVYKDGRQIQVHGDDNEGKGWCMSTDPNDSNGAWKKNIPDGCSPIRTFSVENEMSITNMLGKQLVSATAPARKPGPDEAGWIYRDNESRQEINAEGIGRCYDVRNIDPLNWSNETLISGQRSSVISLVRDDSRRPARHNNKDYVVPKGVVFTSEIIGDSEAESKFAATAYEFENEVLQEYRVGVGVPKAGSAKGSAAFRDVSTQSGKTSSLYTFSKMYKQFYKLDLYFDDPSHQHYVDPRFWEGVRALGHELSAADFINKFGTHYASTTYYGGNFLQRRSVNQSEYSYYESSEQEFKLDIEGTIKKVKFSVGTTQGSKNSSGQTEMVKMSSAKIFTVGGDLNQYRPDLWAQSVLNNLAVVKVQLTRISDLLTPKNFPQIPNIREKQELLLQAIIAAEKEAEQNQSAQQENDFFQKKPAKFQLTVTYMKCTGHGAKEPGGNSEIYGNLKMGFFDRNRKALSTNTFFNRSDKNYLDMSLNYSHNINRSITYSVQPADLQQGFVSVYGNLKEKDLVEIPLSTVSHLAEHAKIYFRSAMDVEAKKTVTFSSKHGDRVVVHYVLRKL